MDFDHWLNTPITVSRPLTLSNSGQVATAETIEGLCRKQFITSEQLSVLDIGQTVSHQVYTNFEVRIDDIITVDGLGTKSPVRVEAIDDQDGETRLWIILV